MSQASNPVSDAEKSREARLEAHFRDLPDEGGAQLRVHARAAVELDVSLGSDHNFYGGFAENLSAGGVFVATHLTRPVGEVIELSIHIPAHNLEIKGTGEVRWIREFNDQSDVPPGMGIKFLELEDGSQEAIDEFLTKREPLFFDDDF